MINDDYANEIDICFSVEISNRSMIQCCVFWIILFVGYRGFIEDQRLASVAKSIKENSVLETVLTKVFQFQFQFQWNSKGGKSIIQTISLNNVHEVIEKGCFFISSLLF